MTKGGHIGPPQRNFLRTIPELLVLKLKHSTQPEYKTGENYGYKTKLPSKRSHHPTLW